MIITLGGQSKPAAESDGIGSLLYQYSPRER